MQGPTRGSGYRWLVPELSDPVSPSPTPVGSRPIAQTAEPADSAARPRKPHPGRGSGLRRRASPLARIGMILFAAGVLAIAAIMIMFASGSHDLPLWLNLTAMLAPVGLGVGLFGVYLEARSKEKRP